VTMPTSAALRPVTSHDRRPGDRLTRDQLVGIVSDLARAPATWQSYVVHHPDRRGQVQLLATSQFEVWLLGWWPGQQVDLHDHGDSDAAYQVVLGELVDVRLEGGELLSHALTTGDTRHAPRGTVHDVVNTSTRVATSIHAYSPPLTAMNFYTAPSRAQRRGSGRQA
jgi:quercetin dioxygenase-like cupin family protein